MTEGRVGFLYNIASNLTQNNETIKLLRSYYLMRCNELTNGYGLPSRHFSKTIRCPRCCIEWTKDAEVKVRPIKLSKRQRQNLKSKKTKHKKKNYKRHGSLRSNEMEQTCTFCKKVTTTKLKKPENEYIKITHIKEQNIMRADIPKESVINKTYKKEKKTQKKKETTNIKVDLKKNTAVNVYSNAYDVFSLKNEKNTLSSSLKGPTKVIKNNKKKKDKFAGLCQKAVLASAKLKQHKPQEQKSINKLDLFLKPSSN